jgi:hypothetical protein
MFWYSFSDASGANGQILNLFFTSVIKAFYNTLILYGTRVSTTLKAKLSQQLKICSKIVGHPLQTIYETAYHKNMLRLANNIVSNSSHVLNREYKLLPSKCRFRVPQFTKIKLEHSNQSTCSTLNYSLDQGEGEGTFMFMSSMCLCFSVLGL